MSLPIDVNCSVPQGSVFGPVQFITYTEDVIAVFKKHGVGHHLYADDKQAYLDVYVYKTSIRHGLHFKTVSLTSEAGVRREDCSLTPTKRN